MNEDILVSSLIDNLTLLQLKLKKVTYVSQKKLLYDPHSLLDN